MNDQDETTEYSLPEPRDGEEDEVYLQALYDARRRQDDRLKKRRLKDL